MSSWRRPKIGVLTGLLTNPQSLELLVRAVAEGGWPESRLDTFERACSHIARERNEEHLLGASPPALSDLLDAAGRLCAVQLIAGIAGYTVGPGESDSAYPSPEECGYVNRERMRIQSLPLPQSCSKPILTPVWSPFIVTLRNFLVPGTSLKLIDKRSSRPTSPRPDNGTRRRRGYGNARACLPGLLRSVRSRAYGSD